MFTQPFIRAQIKENIKAPRHWRLCGEFTGDNFDVTVLTSRGTETVEKYTSDLVSMKGRLFTPKL